MGCLSGVLARVAILAPLAFSNADAHAADWIIAGTILSPTGIIADGAISISDKSITAVGPSASIDMRSPFTVRSGPRTEMVRSLGEVANDCGGIAEAPFSFVSDFLKLGNIRPSPIPRYATAWCRCMPPDLVSMHSARTRVLRGHDTRLNEKSRPVSCTAKLPASRRFSRLRGEMNLGGLCCV